jgi:hypothetical protein
MRKFNELMRLKFEARLTHRQIARSLGIGAGTVSRWLCCTATQQGVVRTVMRFSRRAIAVRHPELDHCIEDPAGEFRLRSLTRHGATSKTPTDYHFEA